MTCPICGVTCRPGDRFCTQCAAALAPPPSSPSAAAGSFTPSGPVPGARPDPHGLGVAGFVLDVVGAALFWVPWLGMLCLIVGTCLSGASVAADRRTGALGPLAIAGLICGLMSLTAGAAVLL